MEIITDLRVLQVPYDGNESYHDHGAIDEIFILPPLRMKNRFQATLDYSFASRGKVSLQTDDQYN